MGDGAEGVITGNIVGAGGGRHDADVAHRRVIGGCGSIRTYAGFMLVSFRRLLGVKGSLQSFGCLNAEVWRSTGVRGDHIVLLRSSVRTMPCKPHELMPDARGQTLEEICDP